MFVAPPPPEGGIRKASDKKKESSLFDESKAPLVEGFGEARYSKLLMCEDTSISYEEPSPNAFSFN